ncbi:MAG: hypothetical protein M1144_05380 [Candidatus Thermoplasmatota archaeon]|nr:hypothetical protein [Candidatus Thermoplasmatota archaeon]
MGTPAGPAPHPPLREGGILVSARGLANHQSEVANSGAPFGIDTPGTKTSGIQEALDRLRQLRQGKARTPEGGRLHVVGDAVLHDTVRIPVWPGLRFEADHLIVDMPEGDGLLVGYDYKELGDIIIGGTSLSIQVLDGPFRGNRGAGALPSYSPRGTTGLHVKQLDGGRIDIGMVRFFTRYGIFLDGYDPVDAHAACIDNLIFVNALTSNGVGLRTMSNSSPQGSFSGGNKIFLGHLLGNFYGILLDADTDEAGRLTPTNPTSINNHLFATVEDSTVLRLSPPPPGAADVVVNATACYLALNAKVTNLQGNQNIVILPGIEHLHRREGADNNVLFAPTLGGARFFQLPENPLVPGKLYRNTSGGVLEIYVSVTFRPSASGQSLYQPMLGSEPANLVRLPPEGGAGGQPFPQTRILRVPSQWYFSFDIRNADLGFALALTGL